MSQTVVSLTNFLLKVVVVVLVLWITGLINPHYFVNTWVAFSTALAVAFVGAITDLTVLPQVGNIRALVVDFVINTVILWGMPNVVHRSAITFTAALACSVVIALVESSTHVFMLRAERIIGKD